MTGAKDYRLLKFSHEILFVEQLTFPSRERFVKSHCLHWTFITHHDVFTESLNSHNWAEIISHDVVVFFCEFYANQSSSRERKVVIFSLDEQVLSLMLKMISRRSSNTNRPKAAYRKFNMPTDDLRYIYEIAARSMFRKLHKMLSTVFVKFPLTNNWLL